MLQITPQHTILLAIEPVDFRKGIDGLVALCKQYLSQDPFSGTLFVFTNKNRKTIRVLTYDGQGFWLATKRFSEGKLAWWPKDDDKTISCSLNSTGLQILLAKGIPEEAKIPKDWKSLKPPEPLALRYT